MANGKQTDVTLRIRARNEAQAALDKTLRALEESKRALEEFGAVSKKQGRTTAELRAEQEKLNAALAKLKGASAGVAGLKSLQAETERVEQKFREAKDELKRLLTEQASGSAKTEAAARKQEAAIERQRQAVKNLSAEYKQLAAAVASAPNNLDRRVAARELSLSRASDDVGAQISGRGAALASRQQALEEARKVNAGSKFNVLVQKEVELRKQSTQLIRQQAAETERAASAEKRVTAEAQKGVAARRQAATEQAKLNKNEEFKVQRTALDYTQRLRGQVLSLATQYAGLFTVIDQVNKALDEQRQMTAIQGRLGVAFDTTDSDKLGAELNFVRETADRLKIDFLQLADSYSKFSAAAKLAGVSSEETRAVFTSLSESLKGVGANTQQVERIFTAVEQIYSKTIVSTEELKNQLGESLPGAYEAFALASKRNTAQLTDDLQKGKVSATEFANFISQYAAKSAKGLGLQLDSLSSAMTDYGNVTRDLRGEFSKGLEGGLKDAIVELTAAMKDPATKEAIRAIGEAIGATIKTMVEFREEIALVVSALALGKTFSVVGGGLKALSGLFVDATGKTKGFRGGATGAADKLKVFTGGIGAATRALGLYGPAIALIMGYEFGSWLYETSEKARQAGVALIGFGRSVGAVWEYLSGEVNLDSLKKTLAEIDRDTTDAFMQQSDAARETARQLEEQRRAQKAAADEAERQKQAMEDQKAITDANVRSLDEGIAANASELAVAALSEEEKKVQEVTDSYKAKTDELRRQLEVLKSSPNVDPAVVQQKSAAVDNAVARNEQQAQAEIAAIRQEYRDAEAKEAQQAADRRAQEAERLANTIKQIERQALQATADTLAEKEALIVAKHNETLAELQDSGADQATIERLTALVEAAKQAEIQELRVADATEKTRRAEEALNDAIAVRDSKIQLISAKVQAGQISQIEGATQIKKLYEETTVEITRLADELLKLLPPTDAQRAAIEALKVETANLGKKQKELGVTAAEVSEQFSSGLTKAFDDIASGAKSAGDAMREFFAQFLRDIALAIIQKQIFNAIGGSSGTFFGFAFHSGGVVGSGGQAVSRKISPAAFASAPRYHTGGIAGLAPNEVPAILKKGEEVLTENDPRHVANGGGKGGGSAPQPINVINTIDTAAMQQAVFSGNGAAKQIINIVRANRSAFQSAMSGA